MYINGDYLKEVEIKDLVGLTFSKVEKIDDRIEFHLDNELYVMLHDQDCCESVWIESIVGDLQDLVGSEILGAEESTNSENPLDQNEESFTWTFYKFRTRKGYVDIRWYGCSNGYYSESVSIAKIPKEVEDESV